MSYTGQTYFPLNTSPFTMVYGNTYSTPTYTNTQYGVNMVKTNNGGNNEIATMLVAAPSTPYSVVAKIIWNGFNLNNGALFSDPGPQEAATGLCFTNGIATSSKLKVLRWGNLNGSGTASGIPVNLYGFCPANQFSNYTTEFSGTEQHCPPMAATGGGWFKLRDDGTNCIYSFSADGVSWQQLYSETRTTYFTATNIGCFVNPYGSDANVLIQSFQIINS